MIANLIERRNSPCKTEFPGVKLKRQIIDYYLKGICNLTQQYGIYAIEISTPSKVHGIYLIQTDDIDIEFSKVFTEYIKKIQPRSSQRANSIFTNHVFSIIYSYFSKLDKTKIQSTSPVQTSRHTIVRNEIAVFSEVLNAIRENLSAIRSQKMLNKIYKKY